MDLRLGPSSRTRIFVRPEDGLRAVIEHAPRAEAAAVEWLERKRWGWCWLFREWRLIGTMAAVTLITGVLVHAVFGANGIVVYRAKRAELKELQSDVDRLQKENALHTERIKELKSDPAAIEKEAREQLHYARKGEVVFVPPDPPPKTAAPTNRAKNGN